jgi:hypothetical protein
VALRSLFRVWLGAHRGALGQADAVLKGAEAESKALKDEFKRPWLLVVDWSF